MSINFLDYRAPYCQSFPILSVISQTEATVEGSSLPSTYISNGFCMDKRSGDTRKQTAEGVWFEGQSLLGSVGFGYLSKKTVRGKEKEKQTIQLKANSNQIERVKSLLVHECFYLYIEAILHHYQAKISSHYVFLRNKQQQWVIMKH